MRRDLTLLLQWPLVTFETGLNGVTVESWTHAVQGPLGIPTYFDNVFETYT